jgi:CubicO group peptidase (beta-lactamase class C family)
MRFRIFTAINPFIMPSTARLLLTTALCSAIFFTTPAQQAASAQSLPPAMTARIDSLFQQWDHTSTPGCAVGVVRNDSLIFAKGYGMANLEYGAPISPETIFHMASVSKQFTAFSIVLLARQGRLSLDDDIHKYLTWFPDLKEKITIRNLLNHTSGIRDQWQLLAIAGTRIDDVITQDQIVKVLGKQEALNFRPGDEYLYSNSGFTLLAEIVRSVTGQTLRQFTDSAIFRPLGMTHTHFHDDYTEIVPNRSYSYERDDKGRYSNDILSYSNAGATSLFTNIDDMSKWIMNFWDHKVGDQQDIAQLTERARLNNGKVLNYALGIGVDSSRGYPRYQHGGADAGYRTFISVYPQLHMGIIVFSNLGNVNTGRKADQVAALFIKDASPQKMATGPPGATPGLAAQAGFTDSAQANLADPGRLTPFTGAYASEDGERFRIAIVGNRMYAVDGYDRDLLVVKGKDTAVLFRDQRVYAVFSKDSLDMYEPGGTRHMWKYDTAARSDAQLATYAGTYYCPELDVNYRIVLKDHRLMIGSAKYNDTPLTLYGDDHLGDDWWWMSQLKVIRDRRKKITGFEVNDGRVRHLWFKKVTG